MISKRLFYPVLVITLLLGCRKDDTPELPSQINARMLAGGVGQSKTWRLLSISEQVETSEPTYLDLEACILDNIYSFSNNSTQSYETTEGESKCSETHPSVVEAGTWAFTSDGKQVMILSSTIVPSNPGTLFSYYGLAFPAEVIELSENAFKVKMTFTQLQGVASLTKYYVFAFTKA